MKSYEKGNKNFWERFFKRTIGEFAYLFLDFKVGNRLQGVGVVDGQHDQSFQPIVEVLPRTSRLNGTVVELKIDVRFSECVVWLCHVIFIGRNSSAHNY